MPHDAAKPSVTNTIVACALLGFLAVAMGVSEAYVVHEGAFFLLPFPVKVGIYWAILLAAFFLLDLLLLRFMGQSPRAVDARQEAPRRENRCVQVLKWFFSFTLTRAAVFRVALVLICCWLPYVIPLYPGVLFSDTSDQLTVFYGDLEGSYSYMYGMGLNDHHPVFDTLYMGSIVWLGEALTGSSNLGLLLLCCVQAVLLATSIAISCCYLRARGLPWGFCLVALLFFCLFPLFPYLALTPLKDTIFIWGYLLFFVGYAEVVRTKGRVLHDRRMLIAAIIVCLLLVLTKKPGIYILLFCGLIALIAFRAEFKVILATLIGPVVVMQLILPAIVFPALDIKPGAKIEMLGSLYQQTARYVIDHPDDVTPKERAVLDELLGYETIAKRYNPLVVDPLHHDMAVEFKPSSGQILEYLGVYVNQGLRHPLSYLKATAALQSGWFNVGERYYIGYNYGMFKESERGPHIVRPDAFIPLVEKVTRGFSRLGTLPILGLFFMPALYTTFIPAFSFLLIWRQHSRRDRRDGDDSATWSWAHGRWALCFIPVVASLIFLYLSPVSVASMNLEAMRYSLPFLYTTPFLVGMAVIAYQTSCVDGVRGTGGTGGDRRASGFSRD